MSFNLLLYKKIVGLLHKVENLVTADFLFG